MILFLVVLFILAVGAGGLAVVGLAAVVVLAVRGGRRHHATALHGTNGHHPSHG